MSPRWVAANQSGARAVGVEIQPVEARADQLSDAFATMATGRADGFIVFGSGRFWSERKRIVELAARHRLPGMFDAREFADDGGLMCYEGATTLEAYGLISKHVDKILRGAKPADLPVEQPTGVHLVINLKTAKALGLTIPPAVLARVDEVIQ
jgi:putative ABC transport system substrate-binding protein